MARISYGVRGRRSSWWVSLPLWVWVLGFPLILAIMVLGPLTKAFLKAYTWPLRAGWKALARHQSSKPVARPVYLVTAPGFVDRNGVFHPFTPVRRSPSA
jgi:hypothetical protein